MGRQKKPTGFAAVVMKVRPIAESARSKAGPMVEQAMDRVGPAMDEAQKKTVAAWSSAASATEPYRKEARKRGVAAWYALRGTEPEKSKGKRRWLLWSGIVAAVGGTVVVAYRMFRNGSAPSWEATEVPKDATRSDADQDATGETPAKAGAHAEAKPGSSTADRMADAKSGRSESGSSAKVAPMSKSDTDDREPVTVGAKHAGRTVNRQRPKPDAES